ncbi:glutaredoxin family protein [Duganella aceris]|uniref:Glutaredoxin family protein n=1 Tax=Duganella aceris TaxID=2703883 RepID=A0ABX0FJ11_9BURK|nr:glutaredoxin family protein [Duganella aceris]NGZ84494.1 glutaredoxin family protein [Duganella aceris]
MKRPALLLLALLCFGTAGAQVYKWKDAKGVTHYSDQPPAPSAPVKSKVEVKSFSGGGAVELPAELAGVARDRPVTLYTTGQCEGCANARALLMARGIPFREKTVNTADDQAALKQAGGGNQLPFLLVGRSRLAGYEQSAWDSLLTEAGYPAEKRLPSNYQYPPAVAAAPPPPPPPQAAPVDEAPRQPPPVNAPPGFQF